MAEYFNRPDFEMFNYDVYAMAGDGCMMEGVASEAASLAGHLKLSNLCWVYDNNKITIEGNTAWAFSEDVATRFLSYGWNVLRVGDANDLEMLERAFDTFKSTHDRPTLIIVDSHIAYGSPNKQDTHAAHGEPLGEEEIRLTKEWGLNNLDILNMGNGGVIPLRQDFIKDNRHVGFEAFGHLTTGLIHFINHSDRDP